IFFFKNLQQKKKKMLPPDLLDIPYKYFCECKLSYIKKHKQTQFCHLSREKILIYKIQNSILFLHCCTNDETEVMPEMSDEEFNEFLPQGTTACFKKPFSANAMEWILNRMSEMKLDYLVNDDLRHQFVVDYIGDQSGYQWL